MYTRMFLTVGALQFCVLFLIKLRCPKKKNFYESKVFYIPFNKRVNSFKEDQLERVYNVEA